MTHNSKSQDLESLYREHKDMVFRVCMRFGRGDSEWAMDRLQEVFLRLAERWELLPDIDNYKAFIYRTTMNLCINNVRRKKNIFHLMSRFFAPGKEIHTAVGTALREPDGAAEDKENLRLMDDAIGQLAPKQRAVIIMYYFEDIEIPAIATILGVNKGTVSRRLKAGREQLADILGKGWFNDHD
ncbi:sigma-70 family RNA polymerase sigma factor [Myxococcota bacterium]|nr:sigma-70 family RNA polymerase sigma factor [Myxococcota bacterium]MBU1535649.1 sigma-70 family RNA polymerase sigma factor [Myxococcota bacterium]